MVGINSEICEQFNSYLQCIKYTRSPISVPFHVFVQFSLFISGIKTKQHSFRILVALH